MAASPPAAPEGSELISEPAEEPEMGPTDGPEVVPAEDMPFAELCELLECLHKKKKERQEQDRMLMNFFEELRMMAAAIPGRKNCSAFPVLRLLLPAQDRERGPYHLRETSLGAALARVLALPPTSPDAVRLTGYRAVANAQESDLAGVAYFVLKNRLARQAGSLTVKDVNDVLDRIANAQVGGKARVLDEAFGTVFRQLSAEQLKWFLRIVLKDLRLRMGHARLLAALHPDAPEYYDSCSSLLKTCEELQAPGAAAGGVRVGSALGPMLAERLDVSRVSRLPAAHYVVENKFDGERFQIHFEDGVFEYFSRRGFSYGRHFGVGDGGGALTPRLRPALAPGVRSLVLDGEMMGWHKERRAFGSKGMAFDVKKITEKSAFQPCFCAFDVLLHNGRSLVGGGGEGLPLRARLGVLDAVVRDVPGALLRSPRRLVTDHSEILEALNKAIEDEEEGIVVKDLDSQYLPSRRNAGWYKVKPEYTEGTMVDLDLVVVGADEAADKRHGRAGSFHVACADVAPGETPHRWVVVGRVSSGLSHEQRQELCGALQPRWLPRAAAPPPARLVFGRDEPALWLLPEHSVVLQIRATELVRVGGAGAGAEGGATHTLRFPRVVAVRDDKPVADATTLAELHALAQGGAVAKLSKRPVSAAALQSGDADGPPPRRRRAARELRVAPHLRAPPDLPDPPDQPEVVSTALAGRELCVVSGDDASSREQLVRLVRRHGGRHVEHVGPDTWLVVAGRAGPRAAAARARGVDVAAAGWLRALPPAAAPARPAPLDLLAASGATLRALSRHYDRFGDSYTQPADEHTLRRCFAKMDDEPEVHLTLPEMLALDRQLFGDQHPFSFLRGCGLHFPAGGARSVAAAMYGAAVVAAADPRRTHALLPAGAAAAAAGGLLVAEAWLDACIERREYVNEKPYLIHSVDVYKP